MPTYEYACDKCGERFEVYQPITDDPLTTHEGCGGAVARVFGNVGISFKGSGFYRTDNSSSRSSSGGKSSKSSGSSSSSSSTSDSGSANSGSASGSSTPKAD